MTHYFQDINNENYNRYLFNTIATFNKKDIITLRNLVENYNKYVKSILGLYLEEFTKKDFEVNTQFVSNSNLLKSEINKYIELFKHSSNSGKRYSYNNMNISLKKEWGLY